MRWPKCLQSGNPSAPRDFLTRLINSTAHQEEATTRERLQVKQEVSRISFQLQCQRLRKSFRKTKQMRKKILDLLSDFNCPHLFWLYPLKLIYSWNVKILQFKNLLRKRITSRCSVFSLHIIFQISYSIVLPTSALTLADFWGYSVRSSAGMRQDLVIV
jgi:hypothetical protein